MKQSVHETANQNNTQFYGWFVCSLAALFYMYEYLLRITPSVMEMELRDFFNITASGLGILSAMYYYAYTPLQAVVGLVTDYYGPKWVLTVAIGLCVIGSILFVLTGNLYIAAVGRLLIGVGSAFAFVGVLKLAAMWLPHHFFARFAGITTALGMLGAMFGDVAMTWVVHISGWRQVLYIGVVIGIVLIPIFIFFVHEHHEDHDKQHTLGAGLRKCISSLWVTLRNKQIINAGVIGCLLYTSLAVFAEMWGIPFLRTVVLDHHISSSALNAMVFFGWLVGAPLSGCISDHFQSRRWPLVIGSILSGSIFTLILLCPALYAHIYVIALLLFLFGLTCSVQIVCFAIGRDHVQVRYVAIAMGLINLFIMLSGVVIQPLASRLLDAFWTGEMSGGIRIYSAETYRLAMSLLPIAIFSACILSWFVKDPKHVRQLAIERAIAEENA